MTIRRSKPRAIGAAAAKITQPIFGRRGFGAGTIVADWPSIVGPDLARATRPERISYPRGERAHGTLHLRVANSSLATELQHLEPQVVERINGYFGYAAIARIALRQGPVPPLRETHETAPAARVAPPDLGDRLAPVDDADLKKALEALGREALGTPERRS